MTPPQAQQHFLEMLKMLPKMEASPWPYLCASAMLDYLARMTIDRASLATAGDAAVYIRFIEDYMPPQYKNFRFSCGKCDLPYQMYYVLRCGIVHSFSLVPDRRFRSARDGRAGSIVISHTSNHLSPFKYPSNQDAVLFSLTRFCTDIELSIERAFYSAASDVALTARIESFLADNPPIQELSVIFGPTSAASQGVSGIAVHGP